MLGARTLSTANKKFVPTINLTNHQLATAENNQNVGCVFILVREGNKIFGNWKVDGKPTKSKQGNEQTRSFEPTNESADCWPAMHSYNFIIRVK